MTKIACPIPAEIREIVGDNVRKAAEQGLAQTRSAYEQLNATSKDTADSLEASYSIASKGVSEFNAKTFEALQANAAAALDFARAISTAKTVQEAIVVQSDHVRKQYAALTAQTKDLGALAQKIAAASAEPIKEQLGKALPLAG